MNVSAEQFRDAISDVRDKTASLGSCLDREAPREIDRLQAAIEELTKLRLKRENKRLVILKETVTREALFAIDRRS